MELQSYSSVRLIINLEGAGKLVPYDNSYALYSSVLSKLEAGGPDLAAAIHEGRTPRFSLSQLLPGGSRRFTKEGIKADRFIFLLTSLDNSLLKTVKDIIGKDRQLQMNGDAFRVHSLSEENVNPSSEIISVVSRSPVILKSENRFVTLSDKYEFRTALICNIESKYLKVTGKLERVKFLNILDGKTKLANFKQARIPCSFIRFTIGAELNMLRVMLHVGVGARTQMGYGFVEEVKGQGQDHEC